MLGRMSEPQLPVPVTWKAEDEPRLWRKLARVAARIAFAEDLVAAFYCAMDRTTPTVVRVTLLAAVAYFVLPTDAIPDILPGLGFADDASVLAATLATLGRHITPAHRERARQRLDTLLS